MSHQKNWDAAFDQAGIDLLGRVFARACMMAQTDRELAALDSSDIQKLIAHRIVALAGGGETNAARLADDAIAYLHECERTRRKLRSMNGAFSEIAA